MKRCEFESGSRYGLLVNLRILEIALNSIQNL